ncbi:hypothetical protein ES703_38800 [subsurface metagenome]
MGFLLYCDKSPRELGIVDSAGNWDLRKFRDHIRTCKYGRYFELVLPKDLIQNLIDAFGGSFRFRKY